MYALLCTKDIDGQIPAGSYIVVNTAGGEPSKGDRVVVQTRDQNWHFGIVDRITKAAVHLVEKRVFPTNRVFAVHRVHSIQYPSD